MNAISFSDIIWFDEKTFLHQNQAMNQDFFREALSSQFNHNQHPGVLWSQWLARVRHFLRSAEDDDRNNCHNENNTTISPQEIIAEGGTNKTILIQKCHFASSSNSNGETENHNLENNQQKTLIAKYIAPRFWKKLIQHHYHQQNEEGNNPLIGGGTLLGKDALKTENLFIRESFNNLSLLLLSTNDEEALANEHPNFCRCLGMGWATFSWNNDEDDDESDSLSSSCCGKTPCLFFEQLDYSLPEFLDKMISKFISNNDIIPSTKIESEKLYQFMKKKLISDIQENVFKKYLSARTQVAKNNLCGHDDDDDDAKNFYYLSAHLDICPNNILVRLISNDMVDDEQSARFQFVLADWDCAAWSVVRCKCQDDGEIIFEDDHVFDSILTRYGTPPFADERIIAVQDEIIDSMSPNNIIDDDTNNNHNENEVEITNVSAFRKFIIAAQPEDKKKRNTMHMSSEFIQSCDEYSFATVLIDEWLKRRVDSLTKPTSGNRVGILHWNDDDDDENDENHASYNSTQEDTRSETLLRKIADSI